MPGQTVTVEAAPRTAPSTTFPATVRIDGAAEVEYFGAGGILRMVLRDLLAATA